VLFGHARWDLCQLLCADELDHSSFLVASLSGVQRDDVSFAHDNAVLAGNGKHIFLIQSS
jgi:hypothetical protein